MARTDQAEGRGRAPWALALLLGLALLWPGLLRADGADGACGSLVQPCEIASGTYLIAHPHGPAKGALVFLHGWGGRADRILGNRALREAVLARGYALVAPNGSPRARGGGLSWAFHPDLPKARDEAAFFAALFDDLVARQGLARDRILLGGFSAGGFMTSYLACDHPQMAAAYVPVSGGFWRPHPESCAGPVRLFHTHGWRDRVVPLEGRILGGGTMAQGDIFHGLEIWRRANGCDGMRADGFAVTGPYLRRSWSDCAPGSALEFALFDGGHSLPEGWADMALDWFEGLGD